MRCARMVRRVGSPVRACCVAALAAFVMLLCAPAATASPLPVAPVGSSPGSGGNTDLKMSGLGPGQGVQGFIAPLGDTSFDPTQGYPAVPPTDFVPLNEGFAGVILATTTATPPQQLNMYCIDIRTLTYPGLGYENGTWDATNVPNLSYVTYILQNYYPPALNPDAPNDNVRAAAVQAAIWFLTDKYVLSPTDPVRPLTEAVVADALANGSAIEPTPTLTITPSTQSAPAGSLAGPYTVNGNDPDTTVTVTVTGGDMFADAAGTQPIANAATVPTGQQIWLRATDPGATTVALAARGLAIVPTGGVFLYDGNTPGVNDAQRLILAEDSQVELTASATADFVDTGSLLVTKTIAGPGAGQQGPITITVTCNGVALPDFVIPAGATGDQQATYTGIPTPATCTVTETVDGANAATTVVTVNGSQTVTLPQDTDPDNQVAAEPITDTYALNPGSLVLTKKVAGPAALLHGPITLQVICDNGVTRSVEIDAAATDPTSVTITDLPAGTRCAVTEPEDGAGGDVEVTVDITAATVTIPAGGTASIDVVDTYTSAAAPLADTGANLTALTASGLLTTLAGAVLLLLGRTSRRRLG